MDKVEIGLFTLFNHDPSHFISKTKNPSSSKVLEVLNSPIGLNLVDGVDIGNLRGVYVFEKNNSYLKLIRNE